MDFRRSVPVAMSVVFLIGTTFLVSTMQNGSLFSFLLVPVIVWAVYFGVPGGMISSVIASLYTILYVATVLGHHHNMPYVAIAVAIFLGVGWTVGRLADMYSRVKKQDAHISMVNRELEQAVEERSLLLVEVHHRIKNDMNFVSSLLMLQAGQSVNVETQTSLYEAADRVRVVAEVYEHLYTGADFRTVEAKPVVEAVLRALQSGAASRQAEITSDIDTLTMSSRESVSLGIVVNELVTNALKHAVPPGGEHGTDDFAKNLIEVTVQGVTDTDKNPDHSIVVSVADNGSGFCQSILDGAEFGYGLAIVEALAGQHNGTMVIKNRNSDRPEEAGNTGAVVSVTLQIDPVSVAASPEDRR